MHMLYMDTCTIYTYVPLTLGWSGTGGAGLWGTSGDTLLTSGFGLCGSGGGTLISPECGVLGISVEEWNK